MPNYKVNNDIYSIPDNEADAFEKDFPDAQLQYRTADGQLYAIPASERSDFLNDFPDAAELGWDTAGTDHATSATSTSFPMFDDEPQGSPKPERGFKAGARESWKGLKAGFQNLWGEAANVFTGSSQESVDALYELDNMLAEGRDVAEETEGAWTDFGAEVRTGLLEFLPGWMIKGWKERVHEKADKQRVLGDIRDALAQTGGDVDKARELLAQKAEEMTYGDKQIQAAAEKFADIKPTEGFGAWVGENAIQMIPSASALIIGALTKSPGAARAIGGIGMGAMTASTAGSSMHEARQAGANDTKTWKVGVTDGMIEYMTEKLPFDRYTSRIFGKVKSNVADDLFDALRADNGTRKELERLLVEANAKLGGKLFSKKNLSEYLADMIAEGASEFSAEALQTMTSIMYEDPENYPTIKEILSNGWEGAKAGFFMGAILGGASKTMEHQQHRARRMEKGSVDIAQVDLGDGETDVVEVVQYDPETDRAVILRDGAFEEVDGTAIKDGYRFSYDEFENARLQEMEDEAINDGVVNPGQIRGMGETVQRDIEELGKFFTPDEIDDIVSGKGTPIEAGVEAQAAARKYMDDVRRLDDLNAAKAEQDRKRRDSYRQKIEDAVGQTFWTEVEGEPMQDGAIIPVSQSVEEVVYADGRTGYVVGSDDAGNLTMVYTDGSKGFASRAEIIDKMNSGEIVSDNIMGLDDYLASKVQLEDAAAESNRVEREQTANIQAVRNAHPVGSVINVGTEEAEVMVTVLAVNADGVIVQMPDGTTPQLTWADVAHAEGQEVKPKTNDELDQEIVDEYKVSYAPAIKAEDTPSAVEKEVEVEQNTPANPLPLKADGSVDQTALWNKEPERWAQWNDEQRQDGGVNSLAYVNGAILKEQAKIAELQAAYEAESDFDARDAIEKEIADTQARVERLTAIQQGYVAQAEAAVAPVVAAEISPTQNESVQSAPAIIQRERTIESVLASLVDGTLSDEEIRANIEANLAEAQKAYDQYAMKAPKMGIDKDAYLTKKQKYEQGLSTLQQEMDFWNNVKRAYVGIMQQETMPTEESFRTVLTIEDMEPSTPQELAARELGLKEGGIKLLWDSVKAHTGWGDGERSKFFGLFRSKEKGGMTIEAAGDRLMEIDREYGLGLLDQSDSMAGVNAILDVLGETNTIGDLRNYIASNREAQLAREATAAYSAIMTEYEATYGETMEERAHYDEVMRSEILINGLSENEQRELNNIIFVEEISQNGTEGYQTEASGVHGTETGSNATDVEPGTEGVYTGGVGILQETQSDNSGRDAESQESQRRSESEGGEQDALPSVPSGESATAVEPSLDEDMPDYTSSASAYFPSDEMKRKFSVMRDRINQWSQKLGIQVRIMETLDDVTNQSARKQIQKGGKVYGYFDTATGEVAFYLPDFLSIKGRELTEEELLSEIDKTYMHEVVSHRGLRGLLGEEKYNELCDMVWNAMTEKQKSNFLNYPGVNGNTRVAADEFIAHFAENVDYNDNRTLWDKIVDFIKNFFNSVGLPSYISNETLAELLRQSYRNLAKNVAAIDTNANKQAEGNIVLRAANGSLVGMHNISEDKLRKVLKQGGLANPSTAVVNIAEYLLDGYGDISLIMPSSLVDANTGDNIGTYTGDAWTPTYPPISRKVDDNGWEMIKDRIRAAVGEDSELYSDIVRGVDNFLDDNHNSKMEFVFLKEKGIEPEIAYKGADGFVGMRNLEVILGVQGLRDGLESYERYKNASPMAKRSFNMWLDAAGNKQAHRELKEQLKKEPKLADVLKLNEDVAFADFNTFTYDIFRKEQDAGKIDTYDTMGAAARYVDANNLRGEFEAWLESLMEQAGAKEVFFAGYTRSGERIYKDNTLENVSRHMRLQGRTNAYDDHGLSATKSALLQRLTSLSQIRKNRARLQNEATYNKEYDALEDRLWSIISQLADMQEVSSNQFMNVDYAESRLQEAFTKRNPIAHLNKEYGYEIDPAGEFATEINSFIKDVQQMPAKYFETKFERPVYLNEFAAVVMPTTTSEGIKQAVSEAGLPIFEYDSSVEGSRKEATLKATEGEGIRFRTTSDVNSQFNAELQQQIDGTLPSGHIYQLGMPSRILRSTGIADAPIQLNSTRLEDKAKNFGHDFDLSEIKDLVNALQSPMGIFAYGDKSKAQNIVVEIQHEGKNFIVGLAINPTVNGRVLDVNSIRNVFPKDNAEWLNWISQDKALYLDKEKIQALIDQQQTNLADVEYFDLDSIAKIVQNFENPSIENIRFRTSNNNQAIFVSNAAKAVEGIKQEKATPEQWLKMIEKNGGLKAGEDKWMGLSDFLKSSDKKTLTKQEVLDFINENMIVIEEQHYSEGDDSLDAKRQEIQESLQAIFDEYVAESEDMNDDMFMKTHYDYAIQKLADELGYSAFNAPFINNNAIVELEFYEDDLDTLHELSNKLGLEKYDGTRNINDTRLSYTTEGLKNRHEIALTVPTIEPWNERDEIHFGDAGDGRAVAWIRFGDAKKLLGTTEVDGKKKFNWAKVLVIDEIQSKRHQEGRERGYISKEKERELREKFEKAKERFFALDESLREKYGSDFANAESNDEYMEILSPEDYREYMNAQMDFSDARLEMNNPRYDAVPDAPFDKNWHELAMKRMLRYAAENDYDVIAWTKGDQQADRYNIGGVVKDIDVADVTKGRFVYLSMNDGNIIKFIVNSEGTVIDGNSDYKGKQLADIVGKELSLRILNAENGTTLSGDDLRIGGEGMKGFYDKILPVFMNKYGKKWGVKVEDIDLSHLESGLTMHSVPVTEEMKASVMEGQVMFRTIPITKEVQDEMDVISATAIVRGNYLKAPNGADTKLTPEQWAMVRTKSFIRWFGDWMKPQRIEKLRRSKPIVVDGDEYVGNYELNKKSAQKYIIDHLRGQYTNADTGDKIHVTNIGAQKVTSHGYNEPIHLASVMYIPRMIEDAIFITEEPNTKRKNEFDTYRYYVCGLKIGGEDYTAKLVVGVSGKETYYDHDLSSIEKGKLIESRGLVPTRRTNEESTLSEVKDKRLISILQEDFSKVVDENGEPKVVYHGSDWNPTDEQPGDAVFMKDRRGIWFTGDIKRAQRFADARTEDGSGVVSAVFLNIRKPSDREYPEGKNDDWRLYYELGYDGWLSWDGKKLFTAVVHSPSQIKSATDNTGEFSAENNDIRFRTKYDVNTNPTEAQKKAGNYKMGHIRLDGYNITIENPKGSVRRGTDSKGNAWENTLNNDYGYIRGTEGVDGDHIDVYLSDNPTEGNVFVIDQVNPDTREFDEHKVMYGFNSAEEAREAYLANFSEGWNGLGTITEVSKDEFKKWIESSHRKTKPFSEYKSVKTIGAQSEGEDMEDNLLPSSGTPTDEVVANGLQLTPAQTAEVAANIFAALPEESRKKVTDSLNGNILGLQDAILQIPTSLATKENWSEDDRAMADVVAEEMTKMAGEMTRPFSASEGLWLLYNNLNKGTDLISQASRALVQRNLGFDAETLAVQEQAREDVRFRTVGDATSNAQASLYNKGAANVWTRLKESFVDMNASVEELVKAIEKRTGKVTQGFENILMALNQQSSRGLAAMESYTQKFLNPMFKAIREIMDKTKLKYEDIVRYVILKHGLERNKKLAQRDAKAHYQEIYDDIISKINSMDDRQKRTYLTNAQLKEADAKANLATLQAADMSSMTDEERKEHKKKLAKAHEAVKEAEEYRERAEKIRSMSEQEVRDELDKIFGKIENGTDSVYKEMRENDYSGISSMFYDQLGVDRSNFTTEEAYQAALMNAKNDKYSSLKDVEAAAEAEVADFEGKVDTKKLWKRINAATKETLRQQYEANMISKDQYDNLRNMFEYYVPLRGFKDNTAEDMYTYYRKPNSTGYTKPILGAEGRKTEAESPFGWIAAMAGSAIASNVKNEAKLALYYFVSNRPENGIATISKTWFEFSHTDPDTGKKVYKPAYPPFSESLSSDAAKASYEQWQKDMEQKRAAGQAYEAGQRLNLGNAVVNISDRNKPEHIVNVKVGGKDYSIIINGNPRAAQAINGDLNIEGTSQDYSALFGPVLRWMSSVNTSYNPEFWITNMQRDLLFTFMNVSASKDPEFRRKFAKNYVKAFKVIKMAAQNENGNIGDSYLEKMYQDFVKNGGVTGYTQIKDSEEWENEISKYMKANDSESIMNGVVMSKMKDGFHALHRFGESLEQVSRFAAFVTAREMGSPMSEAINEAKEITVNFNRKGSGKMISLEESKYLTDRNGQPLNKVERWAVVGLSSIAPLGRRFIMFFNAAIQGLNAMYKLVKNNPGKMVGWSLGYLAVGALNALLHAMMDDDDDYLDMPDYERRNSLMIGGNGTYFKWALPQEARAFYALGDLAVESIMGRNPHQNVIAEALKIGTEILPVNPTEGWKAFMPSVAIPAIELMLNENYTGAPIYNEQKWLSEEEREMTAKWAKAYQGTGTMYVEIAKILNELSGGDARDAGLINIQPEKMQHLVQSAFGGTIRTVDKFFTMITSALDPEEEVTIRQTPFLNRLFTINDERFKNAHVNDVFDYYKKEAEHVVALQKGYIKDRDADALDKLRASEEYRWAQIYSRYKKPLKAIQEKIKVAAGTAERKELLKQQDELKKRMIKEISEL